MRTRGKMKYRPFLLLCTAATVIDVYVTWWAHAALANIPSKCSFMYFCGRIASLQCAYRTLATKQKHRALFVMEHAVTRMRHTTPCTCERATLAQNAGANFSAATTHKQCYNDNSDSHLSSRLQSKGRRHSTSESDAMHRR